MGSADRWGPGWGVVDGCVRSGGQPWHWSVSQGCGSAFVGLELKYTGVTGSTDLRFCSEDSLMLTRI